MDDGIGVGHTLVLELPVWDPLGFFVIRLGLPRRQSLAQQVGMEAQLRQSTRCRAILRREPAGQHVEVKVRGRKRWTKDIGRERGVHDLEMARPVRERPFQISS